MTGRLAFGECVLDCDARGLYYRGALVSLPPKALGLLEVLIEARPRVVRKTELHQRLWPDCFVSAARLTALVAQVRAAIGDDGQHGRLIRTVHGFGYAFSGIALPVPTPSRDAVIAYVRWQGATVGLADGAHVVGRAEDCVVRVDDPRVSRHHATLTVRGESASVQDAASRNGTAVNGARITGQRVLRHGDVLSLGGVELLFLQATNGGSTTIDIRQ